MRFRLRRRSDAPAVSPDSIMDAGVRVLSADPTLPLEAVAERAGVPQREVVRHFPTREALVEAAALRGARRIARAAVLEDGTPPEQVGLLVARIWEDQTPVAPFAALWMRSALHPAVERELEPLRDLLADAIERGAPSHGMRTDIPATTVAWLVEHAVMTCLAGVADGTIDARDGQRLAVTTALSATGLGWEQATDITDRVPDRLAPRRRRE